MSEKHKEFLTKLADLCEEYRAGLGYTIDDDGVHVYIDDEDIVFDAAVPNECSADTIREAIAKT